MQTSFDMIAVLGTEIGRLGLAIWLYSVGIKQVKVGIDWCKKKIQEINLEMTEIKHLKESLNKQEAIIEKLKERIHALEMKTKN